jgi:HD-GYP domain-containing protein (c-di-GMP phosphodiesterase class II)
MSEVLSYLKQSALFSGLDPETIKRISKRFESVHYNEGDLVFSEDDKGECMYILGKGEVSVLKRMGLGQRALSRLHDGEHFGEMALISSDHRTATVKAVAPTECIRLDQDGFDALLGEDARFAQRILSVISNRLKRTDDSAIRDMLRANQALIFALAKLADSRDPETGAHLFRTRDYCTLLAKLLSSHPKYRDVINDAFIEGMYLVTPLHDIGKVAIPDGILLKQGRLTEAEFEIMSRHTTIGADALDTVLNYCDLEVFHMARRIILYHHERYDGKGYPHGLRGEDIPLGARIMTLADIYDALLSKRVYKPPFGYEETKERIASSTGERFDPEMVEVMMAHIDQFEEIHKGYEDRNTLEW